MSPRILPTAKEYVPFGPENVIVGVVDLLSKSSRVTDHDVPDGSPVSMKVTRKSGPGGLVVAITLTVFAPLFAT